jgi:hypothetical protein
MGKYKYCSGETSDKPAIGRSYKWLYTDFDKQKLVEVSQGRVYWKMWCYKC